MKSGRMDAVLREIMGRWIPHVPTPKQLWALTDPHYEILYGGAAGGGKSDWLLMEALQYVDVPNYAALLLRRTFKQLSIADGLIERSKAWLKNTDAEWIKSDKRWTFPSGATITFGHLQHEDDKHDYQGGAWQMIGFDELTQFSQSQFTYLFSRIRRPDDISENDQLARVPLRMRASSNPGGVGHDWVKERFVDSEDENRNFIPAKLADNPFLDSAEYTKSLNQLHPYVREQLLNGNWDVSPPGALYLRDWFHTIETPPMRPDTKIRAWDLASTGEDEQRDPDYTAGVLMSKCGSNLFIEDVRRFRGTPAEVEAALIRQAEADGTEVRIWIEQEPGSSGKIASEYLSRALLGYDVHFERTTGKKPDRAGPVASAAESGRISIVKRPWYEDFMRELEMFTGTKQDSHDDQVDALSLAFSKLAIQKGVTPQDLYAPRAA